MERRLLLAAMRQPEGMGVGKSAMRNACGGNPDHSNSVDPLLSDRQGVGVLLQPLSPCADPCFPGY